MTRINKFIAQSSGISRRSADKLIERGEILVNGNPVDQGYKVQPLDKITSTDKNFKFIRKGNDETETVLLLLNKPEGYVCSRKGQGSKTVYKLLPKKYHQLKPVGRLDKDSSGLLLMTNDGKLADKLTHPRYQKKKVYRVRLNKPLALKDKKQLLRGVKLQDGLSKFVKVDHCSNDEIKVVLAEGRNRQIRRTLKHLNYDVVKLCRIKLDSYSMSGISPGQYKVA